MLNIIHFSNIPDFAITTEMAATVGLPILGLPVYWKRVLQQVDSYAEVVANMEWCDRQE